MMIVSHRPRRARARFPDRPAGAGSTTDVGVKSEAPVDSLAVILLHDLFRGHVHVGAHKRPAGRRLSRLFRLNAATEIGDDKMSVTLHQNVFRLEISVQDACGVQRFNSEDNLSEVKL